MCNAYNRWLGDILSANERLKWVGVVNLDDASAAARQVSECHRLGAVGIMILGTAGDRLLDDPSLLPFYEAMEVARLPLAVHVGWSCPAINNLYSHIYPSGVIAFLMLVLMGFVSLMSGGVLDRVPNLRVVFLEAGSLWIHFILERLQHAFNILGKTFHKWCHGRRRFKRCPPWTTSARAICISAPKSKTPCCRRFWIS
jgi:predicted TIM-barrel fold metal-dependent hydrolase